MRFVSSMSLRRWWCFAAWISLVAAAPGEEPAWTTAADRKPPMTVDEAKAFSKRLATYVVEHHFKKAGPQRGMAYEYYWVARQGKPEQWIQGEALDTMHDGAWFACAMATAFNATGDAYYKDLLTKEQLPFYLKMLNDGDALFNTDRNDAQPAKQAVWADAKEWRLQNREKGFVPYWWDDGASVSLERLREKQPAAFYPCRDEFAGRPNPEFRLSGYSLGSSNHLAQDLGCMLQAAWLLLRASSSADDRHQADEVAAASRHLQECRTRHGAASIPAVLAAVGLATTDAELIRRIPEDVWSKVIAQQNAYRKAVVNPEPGKKYAMPGFADDQQYRYHASLARHRTLNEAAAWRTAYDAYTEGRMIDAYYDDAPRPPGINRFDLYPLNLIDGKPEHLRSERKGPFKGPVPIGSRMGPQNMICCGLALQALRTYPDVWDKAVQEVGAKPLGLAAPDGKPVSRDDVEAWLKRELGGGLRTWEAVFNEYGYIPTGVGCHTTLPDTRWDVFSDTGGYAHLIGAASQWILYLEGKRDWELRNLPQ